MQSFVFKTLVLGASLAAAAYPPIPDGWSTSTFTADNTTECDVLIVGGGATGAYAATRLADAGKTVLVVERGDRLGGHVDTFYAPGTGAPIDYGVEAYIKNAETDWFFQRFNVSLKAAAQSPLPSKVADFARGEILANETVPDFRTLALPLAKYLGVAALFPQIAEGFYDLETVPDDLLRPFGEFVAKYGLEEAVPVVSTFAQGTGDLLQATALYVLQHFGVPHLLGLLAGYLYAPAGNQVVFDRAAALLGPAVLYGSRVAGLRRGDGGVTAVVAAPPGPLRLVRARRLLVTAPPVLDNVGRFDLDAQERALFAQWANVPYFVGVVAGTGLPDLTNFVNVNATAPYRLPSPPFLWHFDSVGVPGYQTVKVIGEPSAPRAQGRVVDDARRLARALGQPSNTTFARWLEHDHLGLHVAPDALRAGFYKDLYALQGRRCTYYTGSAWASDYSPILWAYTEKRVLPHLMDGGGLDVL